MAVSWWWEQGRECFLSGGDTNADERESDAQDEDTRVG